MPEQAIKDRTAIAGIGWTAFSARSGTSIANLAAEASLNAIDDAGLKKVSDRRDRHVLLPVGHLQRPRSGGGARSRAVQPAHQRAPGRRLGVLGHRHSGHGGPRRPVQERARLPSHERTQRAAGAGAAHRAGCARPAAHGVSIGWSYRAPASYGGTRYPIEPSTPPSLSARAVRHRPRGPGRH
jgi:hypothetical protein